MKKFCSTLLGLLLTTCLISCSAQTDKQPLSTHKSSTEKIMKSEKEWKEQLTPEQYQVTREKGTERAFTGEYDNFYEDGMYKCVCCGNPLFDSDTKYKSGSGWPSFYKPLDNSTIDEHRDRSFGMMRTEVTCSKCDAHLGHVFEDGPNPTGLRYCINSAALKFEAEEQQK